MKKFFIIIAIILFSGLMLVNAQKENSKNKFSPHKRFEEMRKEMLSILNQNRKINSDFFDNFFNDDFFSGKYNPFKEIEEIHKSILNSIKEERQKVFKDSWDNWFEERIGEKNIKIKQIETDKEIIMEIETPDKNANIEIKDNYVKISYEKKQKVIDEKDGAKSESFSTEKYLKILAIPENAVPDKHKVEIKDNKIIITFEKK